MTEQPKTMDDLSRFDLYIYIVFTTGWHFMANILPRAAARGKMKA
jgi:hypothetical protein